MHGIRFTTDQLLSATSGRLVVGPRVAGSQTDVSRVVTDSRQARRGDLFWALPGSTHDGADFVSDAWTRGAQGVVTQDPHVHVPADRFALIVDDALSALWRLAESARAQFTGTVVGVTGSVGKTTTREMIHTVLASKFAGVASQRNYNNHVGLPLSLVELRPDHRYGVFELGASAAGEIAALSALCRPQMAVITQIAEAHLSGFGSLEATARAKTELLESLPSNGLAVLNGDCPLLRRNVRRSSLESIWFGRSADCDLVATSVTARRGWLRFRVENQPFAVPVWGRHFLAAALAAIGVGRAFGLTLSEIAEALCEFEPPDMRCEVEFLSQRTILNDSYNACPTTMRAALEVLRDFDADGRRVVVCGDMLELGAGAVAYHQAFGRQLVEVCGADLVIACGANAQATIEAARQAGMPHDRALACGDAHDATELLDELLQPGDVILVKGSRGLRMERVVEWLRDQEQPTQTVVGRHARMLAIAA